MATIEIDGVGRVEVGDNFLKLPPDEQQRVVESIAALSQQPETQRLRAAAQGLTFGLSDEALAAARHPISAAKAAMGDMAAGAPYYGALESERGKLKQYREAYPVSSALWELGGAAVPAIAAEAVTGGTATPAVGATTAPLIARAIEAAPRMIRTGAALGGAYGFGTAEGGVGERIKGTGMGALGGAVAAPLVGAATYPAVAGARAVVDTARRIAGGRGGKAVEAELQRLAAQTGLTVDEIVARVANGETMAENETLRMATRALMAQGGRGEALTRQVMSERPIATREAAMGDIQKYLADVGDDNVLRAVRRSEDAARVAEKQAYGDVFATPRPVPEASTAIADAIKRFPTFASEASAFVRAKTKTDPFFKVGENGAIQLTRDATLEEAEAMRRFLQGKANEAYAKGSPFGEPLKDAELELRSVLDSVSPELGAVRTNAAAIRSQRDAFKAGQEVFGKSADQIEIDFSDLPTEMLPAYRAGFADALRRKAQSAGGTNLMATLSNPARKEGMIFRTLFPGENIDDVMRKIDVAAQSQAARGDIVKGPSTALTQGASRQVGADVNLGDIASAATLNPIAVAQTGMKLVRQLTPGLGEKQRLQVLRILLSEDPNAVANALRDSRGVAALTGAINRIVTGARASATGAGVAAGSRAAQQFTPQ